MTNKLLEDLGDIYENVISASENTAEINEIAEEIFATIAVSMASEGYTAKAIKSFIGNSSEDQILEYYINCQVLDNFVSEEYIIEQVTELEEGLGSAFRIIGRAIMPGLKAVGGGVKSAARVASVATKRAVGPQVRGALSKVKSFVTSPAGKIGLGAAALGGAYGLGRMQGGQQGLAKGPTAPTPPAAPAAPSGGGKGGAGPKGGGKPSAPSAASVDKQYRDLIKKGKTAEAEKFGLEAWKKANPKLAARLNPDGTQKGTGQSEMEKQADELRKLGQKLKTDMAPGTGPQAVSNLPGGNYSPQSTAQMSDRTKEILGTTNPQPKDEKDKIKKAGEMYGKKAFEDTRDAYSIVLDYLISEGHADTISEAHYVMMQMSAEHIQDIVEGDPSFAVTKSSGVRALSSDAAKQLGPKAEELRKKEMGTVALPKLPPA